MIIIFAFLLLRLLIFFLREIKKREDDTSCPSHLLLLLSFQCPLQHTAPLLPLLLPSKVVKNGPSNKRKGKGKRKKKIYERPETASIIHHPMRHITHIEPEQNCLESDRENRPPKSIHRVTRQQVIYLLLLPSSSSSSQN